MSVAATSAALTSATVEALLASATSMGSDASEVELQQTLEELQEQYQQTSNSQTQAQLQQDIAKIQEQVAQAQTGNPAPSAPSHTPQTGATTGNAPQGNAPPGTGIYLNALA